jgi:hypothetical protein
MLMLSAKERERESTSFLSPSKLGFSPELPPRVPERVKPNRLLGQVL